MVKGERTVRFHDRKDLGGRAWCGGPFACPDRASACWGQVVLRTGTYYITGAVMMRSLQTQK